MIIDGIEYIILRELEKNNFVLSESLLQYLSFITFRNESTVKNIALALIRKGFDAKGSVKFVVKYVDRIEEVLFNYNDVELETQLMENIYLYITSDDNETLRKTSEKIRDAFKIPKSFPIYYPEFIEIILQIISASLKKARIRISESHPEALAELLMTPDYKPLATLVLFVLRNINYEEILSKSIQNISLRLPEKIKKKKTT